MKRARLIVLPLLAVTAVTAGATAVIPASAQASTTKNCRNGIGAGNNTTCELARALFRKVGRDAENIADGRRVWVRSAVTGRSYAFFLYRADMGSFTSRAYGVGVLSVRIAT